MRHRHQIVFGPGRAVPLDGNAKARIEAAARAYNARNRQPGQHKGPITRTFLEVLEALLWKFHNAQTGKCFPSYEAIAEKAECARSTVAEALKALEWAGVLTWQRRIVRALVKGVDLFGRAENRWKILRTSNAYVFLDPLSKSENRPGILNQGIDIGLIPSPDPNSALERALARLGEGLKSKIAHERKPACV